MAKKKLTLKGVERTPEDIRADKSGAHGKEGSRKDIAADKRLLAKLNKRRK